MSVVKNMAQLLDKDYSMDVENFSDTMKYNVKMSEAIDVGSSKLRAATHNFDNDVRYLGKKICRFELLDMISDEEPEVGCVNPNSPQSSTDDITDDAQSTDKISNDAQSTDDITDDAPSSDDITNDEKNNDTYNVDEGEESNLTNVKKAVGHHMEMHNDRLEFRNMKDNDSALSALLELHDALLSCRMLEQEMLMSVNKLPRPVVFKQMMPSLGNLYNQQLHKTRKKVKMLLRELLQLQEILLGLKKDEPDEDGVDWMEQANNIDSTLKLRHSDFEKVRNKILLDLSNRVNLFMPLSSHKSFNSQTTNILTQIKQMMSEKLRFVKRTRVQRSVYKIIGKTDEEAQGELNADRSTDAEIFDDDDFYHQMLVEMTKRKTSNLKDMMDISRHWSKISKMKKLKKNVDPKASKGRRTRYTIHKKLVNFMAPMPNKKFCSENQREGLFEELSRTKRLKENEINWMFQ